MLEKLQTLTLGPRARLALFIPARVPLEQYERYQRMLKAWLPSDAAPAIIIDAAASFQAIRPKARTKANLPLAATRRLTRMSRAAKRKIYIRHRIKLWEKGILSPDELKKSFA